MGKTKRGKGTKIMAFPDGSSIALSIHTERVLRQMPAAVIVVETPSGEVISVNKEAQRWTEQVLGQRVPLELGEYLDLQESIAV